MHRLAYLESAGQTPVMPASGPAVRSGRSHPRPGDRADPPRRSRRRAGRGLRRPAGDVPLQPEPGRTGRDLPPEIMRQLCDAAGPAGSHAARCAPRSSWSSTPGGAPRRSARCPGTAWTRDGDGAPVLVYDNHKAGRARRRLPISETTAKVIIAQQQRVRARFPGTPLAS